MSHVRIDSRRRAGGRRLSGRLGLVLLGLVAMLSAAGCMADPLVAMNDEVHPAGGRFIVTAAFSPWHHGYYTAAVTIHNETGRTLKIKPSMFRLEGTPPTGFVPAERIPLMMGRAGYRMPEEVEPRCTAQGEIYYGIRGTETPKGKVRLYVDLPDGEHAFEWTLIQ
jgi:hypothetical protein